MLLSEMFGVERGETFGIKECTDRFMVIVDDFYTEFLRIQGYGKGEWVCADTYAIYQVIKSAPDGIIHLPLPLTDEQREQLKAIWTLGGRWLAKDNPGDTFAFGYKPVKSNDWLSWMMSNDDKDKILFSVYRDLDVCDLVSWSDHEPLDIVAALRNAGESNREMPIL